MSTLDQTAAVRILTSFAQVNEVGVPYKGIEISNISTLDKDGNTFTWKDSGEEYAIVNFKAQNAHGRNQSIAYLKEGKYQDACNENLSMRMSIPEAAKLAKGQIGTLILREVALKDEKTGELTGEVARLPYKFSAAPAVSADNFDFSALVKATEEPAVEA